MPEGSEIMDWIGGLPDRVQSAVLSQMTETRIPEGKVLYARHEEPRFIYRVVAGKARMYFLTESGRELVIRLYGPGETIGDLAAVDGLPYPVFVETLTPCRLLVLARERFVALRQTHPEINAALVDYLGAGLRSALGLIEESTIFSLDERVAARLAWLAATAAARNEDIANVEVAQKELGLMVGASRQAINKALGELQRAGLVETRYGAVTIRDLDGLRKLARMAPLGRAKNSSNDN